MIISPQEKEMLVKSIIELEEIELKDQDDTKEEVYKKLMIYYLIDEQPMKAKFLWKRIPQNVKSTNNSELHRVWSLCQLLIQRKHKQAFDFANQIKNTNCEWSNSEIELLFNKLVEWSREKLFDSFNLAYSTINIQELANFLSTSTDNAIELGLKRNWTLDESRSFMIPKKLEKTQIVDIPNQIQMQQLTSLVSYLET